MGKIQCIVFYLYGIEIAHYSGIRDNSSFKALKQINNQVERLLDVMEDAKRKYNFIIFSDHGQSEGTTFYQKYGITLNELVKKIFAR